VVCNSRIKFGTFLDRFAGDFDLVASGHYARLLEAGPERDGQGGGEGQGKSESESEGGGGGGGGGVGVGGSGGGGAGARQVVLVQSPDAHKDQTYFLCHLRQAQLSRLCFPLGGMPKSEVRRLAAHFALPNAGRPDSQGLCFLGKVRFRDFLREHIADAPGDIVDADTGAVVGRHLGVHLHTHGQRSGLGLSGGPWYVVDKVAERNEVRVSRTYYEDGGKWRRDRLEVEDVNWLAGRVADGVADGEPTRRFRVKLRHGPVLASCTATFSRGGRFAAVQLDARDQGIAPGQFAVFYDAEGACVAAGPIAAGST